MNDTHHNEIMHKLGVLEGKVDGIISRQDIANGRTDKNEEKIENLGKNQDKLEGELSAFSWIFGVTIAIVGLALAFWQLIKIPTA